MEIPQICRRLIVNFNMKDQKKDSFFVQHLLDLAERAYRLDYPVFTDFMTTKELSLFQQNRSSFRGVRVVTWGGHIDCDHQMGGFFPLTTDTEEDISCFPICCIHITATNPKYANELGHRDYLGAILNLGMERAMIGDIRIHEHTAYVFCHQDFVPFIISHLTQIRRCAVMCEQVHSFKEIPAQQYEQIQRSVASLRLDNVIAAMIGSARGKAAQLITQGNVLADYEERTSVSYRCKNTSIVTIRGYGKFKLFAQDNDVTRKGKQKITIYKYV